MKISADLCFTIIGLGNLMESILPYIADTVGKDNLNRQVNATTADSDDLEEKKSRLGIKVLLKDNLKALKEMAPDIVFFAPPPNVAQEIIQTDLKNYFDFLRDKEASLPEIYSFPPVPPGSFYNQVLGEDIFVVNILPNTVNKIRGIPLKREGVSICTFSTKWPSESIDRLKMILSPLGAIIELDPEDLIPLLGGAVMTHVLPEVALTISDILEENGEKTSYQDLAGYMRARFQLNSGFVPEESDPCSVDAVDEDLKTFLDSVIIGWYKGLIQYCMEVDFSQEKAIEILNPMIDHQLHVVQKEFREIIEDNVKVEATKGGVLEKGIRSFHEQIKPLIEKAYAGLPGSSKEPLQSAIFDGIGKIAHGVKNHGMALSNRK